MLFDSIAFDPVRDIAPVEQFGFIDLKTALDSSMVPSQLPESESDYNGIDEPAQILGKPHDIFEAIDTQKALESAAAAESAGSSGEKDDA